MTALASRRPTSAAVPATLPKAPDMPPAVSHALACAMQPVIGKGRYGDDDPGFAMAPPALSPQDHAAARQTAEYFDALLAHTVTREHLAAWLLPINAASRNPQSPTDFAFRCDALAALLDDLPAAAFTHETRRRMPTGFFPSHEDIREIIQPIADDWRRKRDALRGLRQAEPERRPDFEPPTAEQREAMKAKAQETIAFLRNQAAERERSGPRNAKPLPLAPHHLLAAYEAAAAEGNAAAAFRAQQLRDAMGGGK